jgi:hypothetical protein
VVLVVPAVAQVKRVRVNSCVFVVVRNTGVTDERVDAPPLCVGMRDCVETSRRGREEAGYGVVERGCNDAYVSF